MRKIGLWVIGGLLLLLPFASASGQEPGATRKEVDELKSKVEQPGKMIESLRLQLSNPTEGAWYDRVELGGAVSSVMQGSDGADDDGTDTTARYELELQCHLAPGDLVYLHVDGGSGDGLDSRIPTLSSFNSNAFGDDNHVTVSEAWYEHRFQWLGTVLQVGKVCFGGPGDSCASDAILFDENVYANNERSQFLSGGFVNNLALEFPDNGPGLMVRISPTKTLDISAGVADANGEWTGLLDDVFSIVELNFKPMIMSHPGNYRFYGWFNGSDHKDRSDPAKTRESNHGFGLSFDQEIREGVGIFIRVGWQRARVSQVGHAWSAGVQCSGAIFGREQDTAGLAYGMAVIGDDWRALDRVNGIHSGDEHHVELYYRFIVNEHLAISPDIQWVKHPNGDRDSEDAWAVGIRAHVFF